MKQVEKRRITLAAARVNAGYTQAEVAAILHIGKQTLCNWENGKTEPKTSQAQLLAELYNWPYGQIIFLPVESNKI